MSSLTPSGRIESLDALRGFAIFGILLINIQVFSGYGFIGLDARAALPGSSHDEQIRTVLDVLVRAKFYSLFSLLFGYSFTMMARKTAASATSSHLLRMGGLLVIGLAHSLLLWPWDILVLYAVMGLLLTPFLNRGPVLLFAAGLIVLLLTGLLSYFGPSLGLPDGRGEYPIRVLQEQVPALAGGSYREVLVANFHLTGSIMVEWLQGLRPLRVFAMFLLGAAGAALALADPDTRRRGLLWALASIGLVAGLGLSLADNRIDLAEDYGRAAWVAADILAAPLLAIGYAAVLMLWWNSRLGIVALLAKPVRAALAPVGRMALTNYLLQSAVCVPLFYGFGWGRFAEVSMGRLMLFCAGLFLAQMIVSALWLRFFRQGPIEWLWRWQIKGQRPRLLNRPAPG